MTDSRRSPDPASEIRRAWSDFRLAKLQQLVAETIALLDSVEPADVLDGQHNEFEARLPAGPVADALEACCAELREESGMQGSLARRMNHCEVVRRHLADHPEWTVTFCESFEKYRALAGELLNRAFQDTPVDSPSAPPR